MSSSQTLRWRIEQALRPPDNVSIGLQRAYHTMLVGCMMAFATHGFFFGTFVFAELWGLAAFNIGSMATYLLGIYLLRARGAVHLTRAIGAVEVIAHQLLAVSVLGWDYGFQYYLFVVPAFVFLASDPDGSKVPGSITAFGVTALGGLWWLTQTTEVAVVPELEPWADTIYGANLIVSAVLIANFSWVYSRITRASEERLLAASDAAQSANAAKGEFLATMSHELRTPMNAIIGFTAAALRRPDTPGTTRRDLRRIEGASQALLGLINDTLDFSKIEAGKLEVVKVPVDQHELLGQVAEMFSMEAAKKGVELLLDMPADLPRGVCTDPMRLRQVLTNLVSNAVKFTDEGEVTLRVRYEELPPGRIAVHYEVTDTGIGIEADAVPALFEPFVQADGSVQRRYGGTGLGLSICRHLVRLMGGELVATSAPGQGSTFAFSLPLERADDSLDEGASTASFRNLRVLLADDNAAAREIFARMLESFGFPTTTVPDGRAALDALDAQPYDLLLIDWMMPELDGLEVARKVAERPDDQRPKVLLVTAHSRERALDDADDALLDGVLFKPVTPSDLYDAIQSAARGLGPAPEPTHPGIEAALAGMRVLVVDDVDYNREIAQETLQSVGARVDLASSGPEAIVAVQKRRYDAVLMDIQMPEMDGFTATSRIRALPGLSELPILAMTAHALVGDRQRSLDAGMNDHVTKPIDRLALVHSLRPFLPESPRPATTPQTVATRREAGLPPTLPGFQLRQALDRVAGNERLLLELLVRFRAEHAEAHARIASAVRQGDRAAGAAIAHTVKGIAGSLGADRVYVAASVLESALRHDESLDSPLATFEAALDEAVAVLGVLEAPAPRAVRGEVGDLDAWLDELDERLAAQRIDAIDLAERVAAALPGDDGAALREAVAGLDFARARALVAAQRAARRAAPATGTPTDTPGGSDPS
jgi:signal transduction histidine kinase/CheY-like chemotaxis protein